MGRIVVTGKSDPVRTGRCRGVLNSMLKGHAMPAFTFEKLSPSTGPGASAVPAAKEPLARKPAAKTSPAKTSLAKTAFAKTPRGLFGHMIDRFVEARIRKN